MYCENCGNEIRPGEAECSRCHSAEDQVKILTTEEKRDFQGMTIEASDAAGQEHYQHGEEPRPQRSSYFKVVSFGGTSLWTKLFVAGIFLFLIFVALPVFVFGAGLSLLIWFILRLLNR